MNGSSPGVRPRVVVVAAVVALALASLGAAAGCRLLTEGAEPAAAKSGTGELRTDLDPLLKRFPVLAEATGARWMSGTFGRADSPGPSTYWIDAVVTLPATRVEQLVAEHAPAAGGGAPEVVEGLRAELPAGPFLTGDALDRAFAHERWSASVHLDPDTGLVVLTAIGT